MHHQEFEPPEELRDAIKCFWYNSRDVGELQSSFKVLPDGYAEIIFYFGSALGVSYNGVSQLLPSPFMIGLLNQPVIFHAKNRLEIIGIRCFPWTVFDLLGLPSGKDGVRIFEHPIARLQSTLKAGIAMREAKGAMPVSQIAAAAHATVRTLERKFKESSGYTVKDVSGLMRFEQARNHLGLYPASNLAGLAHELGYSDQAHLNREFKRYSGTTPAAFARIVRKRKQALSSDFVAFIQA